MLNFQTVPSTGRWQYSLRQSPLKLELDERWSGFLEVLKLLHFEGDMPSPNDSIMFRRHRFKAGQSVFSMDQPFDGLYVVRLGAMKTLVTRRDGTEHVLAFPMKGDLLGFDGVCQNKYLSQVTALSDCDLIKLPSAELFSPDRVSDDVERLMYWAISREIVQEQSIYASFQSAKSDARVARFLRMQSERFAVMGYSPNRFALPMTRRDIGNHLNVTLETVSRAFSALSRLGIITVVRREINILSLDALRRLED